MKGLRVTEPFTLGKHGVLECDYELEGSEVYSIKWYKDNQEFYRILPGMEHQVDFFEVPGINMDQQHCTGAHLRQGRGGCLRL